MVNSPDIKRILQEYNSNIQRYERFRAVCETLLKQLLTLGGYRVHSVSSRLKERKSLAKKLEREDANYKSISELTDIVGIRVITYFEDEVDNIGTLIEKEFDIDRVNSIDKRKVLDPDRFGYLSLHYICLLNKARQRLAEYSDLGDLRCEIQVRSILQHAWAEIEHDLGYKAKLSIPAVIRRRFSRLAGMLEVADDEFRHIRTDLATYEADVLSHFAASAASIELDAVSIKIFIDRDLALRKLDTAIAKASNLPLRGMLKPEPFVARFKALGLRTVQDLRQAVRDYRPLVLKWWRQVSKDMPPHRSFSRGIGLFHLFQVMVATKYSISEAINIFKRFGLGPPSEMRSWITQIRKALVVKNKTPHSRKLHSPNKARPVGNKIAKNR